MTEKWNNRYQNIHSLPAVNPLLLQWQHLLPIGGHGLDLACGLGQNAFYLAQQGFSMEAWDSASVAIERIQHYAQANGLAVQGKLVDLEKDTLIVQPQQHADRDSKSSVESQQCHTFAPFDFIIVSAYLQRSLCPQIISWLKPKGILFYHTFNQVAVVKKANKPGNPDYLLKPAELLTLFGTTTAFGILG